MNDPFFDENREMPAMRVERRELHSRYLNQQRIFPVPLELRWLRPANSRVAFLVSMEEVSNANAADPVPR